MGWLWKNTELHKDKKINKPFRVKVPRTRMDRKKASKPRKVIGRLYKKDYKKYRVTKKRVKKIW